MMLKCSNGFCLKEEHEGDIYTKKKYMYIYMYNMYNMYINIYHYNSKCLT